MSNTQGHVESHLWSVAIGLAKLQGDSNQINQRFFAALGILKDFKSTLQNKMMAAEIIASYSELDLANLSQTLVALDQQIRNQVNVPKESSAGVASIILSGRRYDGTYPIDRLVQFSRVTPSYEAAAILSVMNVPSDQLTGKFQSFKWLFNSWGYNPSEDTELASAFLAISDFGPDDIRTKMAIILNSLRTYLEYPLVAAAILTSIPTLEANETLDLMEKCYTLLGAYNTGLERSELVSLSALMIHGIRNELVKELDSTAKITKTPVQFTYGRTGGFFFLYGPIFIAHSSYHSAFGGIGGFHPAHGHGVGGFTG